MGPVPIALILLSASVLAIVVARLVERRRGEGAGAAALGGAVGLPFGALLIVPLLDQPDGAPTAGPTRPVCRISPAPGPEGRTANGLVTRPRHCRPDGYRGESYALRGAVIKSSDGRNLRVTPRSVTGYVDSSNIIGGRPQISGWAADVKAGRPARSILVFSGGRFLGAVKPTIPRPDVELSGDRPGGELAGYSFELPRVSGQPRPLQLFGVVGREASPLRLDCTNRSLRFGCDPAA